MKTGALVTDEHGSSMLLDGSIISVDWDLVKKTADDYDYRTHLTLWTDRIETVFQDLVGVDGLTEKFKVSVGKPGLLSFHYGKIHIRSIEAYADTPGHEIREEYGQGKDTEGRLKSLVQFMSDVDKETRELGLDKKAGTAASTAHALWRQRFNPGGKWRCLQDDNAPEDMDWTRRALYGGQTIAKVRGVVYTPGNMPEAIVKRLDAPAFETPPGFRIWRIDATSAYPSHMRRDFGYPWANVTDRFDLDDKHGVAEVDIEINSDGPRVLPLRLVKAGLVRTIWPEGPGVLQGVYSYLTLREAISHGAVIRTVHRARGYRTTHHPLKRLVGSVWRHQGTIERKCVRKVIKSYSRRLNGRFGVSRWRSELIPLWEYFKMMEKDDDAPLPRMTIGSDWCIMRTQQEKYAAYAQPLWSATTIDRATIVLSRIVHELETSGLRVLYVDTDSVMFIAREGAQGLPDVPDTVRARMLQKGLGGWKVDYVGDWCAIMGEKFYALDSGRCAFAGVPRDIQSELLHNGCASYAQEATIFSPAREINFRLRAGQLEEG